MSDLKELSNLQKYNGKEYNLWKFQAQAFLDGRGFMGIVDGSELMPVLPSLPSSSPVPEIQFGRTLFSELTPAPDEGMSPAERDAVQTAILDFKKRDKQAFSILIQLVDKPILHQIINCKTSKEIWDKLALIHQRTAVQSLYQLQETYYNMRLGENDDMATFIGKIEMLNSQIEELGARPFSEEMVISKMLSNLPAPYDTFQTMWKTVASEQQTLSNLQMWLLDEERAIRKRQTDTAQTSAFYSRSGSSRMTGHPGKYRSQPSDNGYVSGPAPDGSRHHMYHEQQAPHYQRSQDIAARKRVSRCGNCGEMGHWHKECPRPPRKSAPVRSHLHQNSMDHHNPSRDSSSPSQDSRYPDRSPHVTVNSNTTSRAYMVQLLDQEVHSTDWLADSGSSHHMSDQRHWFTDFTAVPTGTWPVQAVAGHITYVEGIGNIPMKSMSGISGSKGCSMTSCTCRLFKETCSQFLLQGSRMSIHCTPRQAVRCCQMV